MENSWNQRIARFWPLLLVLACVGCDQWTKRLAAEHLRHSPPRSYFGDALRIQYAENPGAFLGAGANLPAEARFWLLIVVNGLFLGAVVWVSLRRGIGGRWQSTALALLVAGGVGNLIDRLVNGGLVVDFLNLGIGPLRTGIFNVADVAITTGFVLLVLAPTPAHEASAP